MTLCLTLIQHSWQLRSPRAGKERRSHKGLCVFVREVQTCSVTCLSTEEDERG